MGFLRAIRDWSERRQRASEAQQQLRELFAQAGMNFMHLEPNLHRALLTLAITAGADYTMRRFAVMGKEVDNLPGLTSAQRASKLIEVIDEEASLARRGYGDYFRR